MHNIIAHSESKYIPCIPGTNSMPCGEKGKKGGVKDKGERGDRGEGEGIRRREQAGNRNLAKVHINSSIRALSVDIRGSITLNDSVGMTVLCC